MDKRPGRGVRKLKDRDSAAQTRFLLAFARGGIPGGFLGALGGVYLSVAHGAPGWTILAGILVGAAAVTLTGYYGPELLGAAAGRILAPSGSSTPRRREYSYPQSLAARGMYDDAVAAYERAALEAADDPEPLVQAARISRDHLADVPAAARHFRAARQRAGRDPARALLITRELAELWLTRSPTPGKALPELARMADLYPGHPESEWAATELAALKERLPAEEE